MHVVATLNITSRTHVPPFSAEFQGCTTISYTIKEKFPELNKGLSVEDKASLLEMDVQFPL
jgi:hypothetical protein